MVIKMNGLRIYPSSYIKYLGVYLDASLNGNQHCNLLVRKLKRANGILSKARHYVPTGELLSIYHAIFSSHLVYGCQILGQSINIFTNKSFQTPKQSNENFIICRFFMLMLTRFTKCSIS